MVEEGNRQEARGKSGQEARGKSGQEARGEERFTAIASVSCHKLKSQ